MKNWLVALFGVSLAAISYTAYELELKTPASPPTLQKAAATGQSVTTVSPQKPKKSVQAPTSAAPESLGVAVDKTETAGGAPAAMEPDANADAADAGASGTPAAIARQAGEVEQPSVADNVAKPVASAPSEPTKPEPANPEKVPPPTAQETETAGLQSQAEQDPATQQQPSAPSAILAPVAKAVDSVRKMLSGEGDSPSVAKVEEPQDPVDQKNTASPPAIAKEAAPKGLVERAVKAVSDLVAPKNALDEASKTKNAAVEETKPKPEKPAVAPSDETKVAVRAPEAKTSTITPETPADSPVVPSFDVVRVERDGSAVIAGRAEPGAEIELRAGDKILGTARASRRGEFVIIPDNPIPSGSSALALEAKSSDGKVTRSDQVVTVAVPEPEAAPTAKIAAAPKPVPAPAPVSQAPVVKSPAATISEQNIAAAKPPATPAPARQDQAAKSPVSALPEQKVAAASPPNNNDQTAPAKVMPETVAKAATKNEVVSATELPKASVLPPVQQKVETQPRTETKIADAPSAATGLPDASSKAQPPAAAPAPMAKLDDAKTVAPVKSDGLENTQTAIIVPEPAERPAALDENLQARNEKPAENTTILAKPAVADAKPAIPVTAPKSKEVVVAVAPEVNSSPAGGADAQANKSRPTDPGAQVATAAVVPKAEAKPPTASPAPQSAQTPSPPPVQPVAEPATAAAVPPKSSEGATAPAIAKAPQPQTANSQIANSQAAESRTAETQTAETKPPVKLSEPLVVVSEPGNPSRVLQGGNAKPKAPITFDTVDYDDEGQIILAGRVAPGADVRAYLGAAHLGDAKADPAGRWVLRTTRQIDPGNYQLRVDKIDFGGKVLARVTAPFERATPEAVARVRADGEVIIQPGDNLWNISRSLYGSGTQYTVIYDANRNQISKPDLIFPGQVFMTPGATVEKVAGATGG